MDKALMTKPQPPPTEREWFNLFLSIHKQLKLIAEAAQRAHPDMSNFGSK